MKLSFSGAPDVVASLTNVWPRIIHPHFVAKHGPGVESVEVLDLPHFKVITAERSTSPRVSPSPGLRPVSP